MTVFSDFRLQFGAGSEVQTDEVVVINIPIPGTSLYGGYFCGLTNDAIIGATSTAYGVYSLAAKAGTRYPIIVQGTPSGDNIFMDRMNGMLIADTARTVFMTYPFYGRLFHSWEQSHKVIDLSSSSIVAFGGGTTEIWKETIVQPEAFIGMRVQYPLALNAMSANPAIITLALLVDTVSKLTLATGTTVALSATTFATRVKCPTGSVLSITSNATPATCAFGPVITLIRG